MTMQMQTINVTVTGTQQELAALLRQGSQQTGAAKPERDFHADRSVGVQLVGGKFTMA